METPTSNDSPGPPGGAPHPVSPQNKASWKSWLVAAAVTAAGVVAVVAVLGSRGGAGDATVAADNQGGANSAGPGRGDVPGGAGRGTRGEVTAIDGTRLTVRATDQQGATSTVVVETTAETDVTESVDGSLADLKTGDTIVVMGDDASGSITATSITAGQMPMGGGGAQQGRPEGFQRPEGSQPPGGAAGRRTAPQQPADGQRPGGVTTGEIASISDATITIKDQDGETVTVTTTPETTVRVTKTRAVSDIDVGDTITAMGETSEGVVKASVIRIGDLGFGGQRGRGAPGGAPGRQPGATTGG